MFTYERMINEAREYSGEWAYPDQFGITFAIRTGRVWYGVGGRAVHKAEVENYGGRENVKVWNDPDDALDYLSAKNRGAYQALPKAVVKKLPPVAPKGDPKRRAKIANAIWKGAKDKGGYTLVRHPETGKRVTLKAGGKRKVGLPSGVKLPGMAKYSQGVWIDDLDLDDLMKLAGMLDIQGV